MNYYELLGIDQEADTDEIKRSYREKLKEWHPDKNPDRREQAEEMTKTLNIAYGVLSNPQQKRHYDRVIRFSNGKNYGHYVNDDAFSSKIKHPSMSLRRILNDVKDLYNLSKDAVRGNYKLHPVNLGIIAGGLLYFIIPTDLIPDFIPLVGLVDDIAVLTTIVKSMQGELQKYRSWKSDKI